MNLRGFRIIQGTTVVGSWDAEQAGEEISKDKFFLTRWTAADEDTAEGTDGGLQMVEYWDAQSVFENKEESLTFGEGYVTRDWNSSSPSACVL